MEYVSGIIFLKINFLKNVDFFGFVVFGLVFLVSFPFLFKISFMLSGTKFYWLTL